ncbi:MAG: biotin/lipoyl-containing protein [Clostridia bacterium]
MLYKVTLNGKIYEVDVEKGDAVIQAEYEAAQPVATPVAAPVVAAAPVAVAPVASAVAAKGEVVNAPLPGNINVIKVTSGQAVKAGDTLFILEAMKMENEIVAPKDGKIGQIFVTKGATVSTGAPLVEIL